MASIEERILKDIDIFNVNIREVDRGKLDARQKKVVELAEMYAKDSMSFFKKKDYYTSFSSIAYAHGLLDSIRTQNGIIE